jgi:hypothetical protein
MKNSNNKTRRTKFSQDLRKILVDLAEESLQSTDNQFISKSGLNQMKGSM